MMMIMKGRSCFHTLLLGLSTIFLTDRVSIVVNAQPSAAVRPADSVTSAIEAILSAGEAALNQSVFIYQTPDQQWLPSDVFTLPSFVEGLRVMYEDGIANKYFYMGTEGSASESHIYGVVNIAAFLAQVMKESLQYNACDENNWDLFNGRYPISNSCGQLSQSYQDYKCPADEEYLECPVDPDMTITATTNAKWYGAPGPFKCGPTSLYPTTGYWDYLYECNRSWADPPESCTAYPDQKAGKEVTTEVVANRNGRTDVEGCCWWGRGAIQTSGVCNYGRMNYYLGKRAADEGRPSRYPTIDLCRTPDAICASTDYPELKWVAGMFYWVYSVQTYEEDGWNYLTELHSYVDGGMQGDDFINAVSGIVNRGCHNPPCATGEVDGGADRLANFRKVMAALVPIPGTPIAPIVSPISTPVLAPIASPVAAPIASPVAAPIASPVTRPSVAPLAQSAPKPAAPWTGTMCCETGETALKTIPGCGSFYQCVSGKVVANSLTPCPSGLVFDVSVSACNWETDCVAQECPTQAPVVGDPTVSAGNDDGTDDWFKSDGFDKDVVDVVNGVKVTEDALSQEDIAESGGSSVFLEQMIPLVMMNMLIGFVMSQ